MSSITNLDVLEVVPEDLQPLRLLLRGLVGPAELLLEELELAADKVVLLLLGPPPPEGTVVGGRGGRKGQAEDGEGDLMVEWYKRS